MSSQRLRNWMLGGLFACLSIGLHGAEGVGPIDVSLEVMALHHGAHGYQTVVARLANRDAKRKHRVRLVLEGVDIGDYRLGEVTRETEVAASSHASILVQVPVAVPSMFQQCRVEIDGKFGGRVPADLRAGMAHLAMGHRGYMGTSKVAPSVELDVYVGQRVSRDALEQALLSALGGRVPLALAERRIDEWPGRWSAYSAYDMVVVTGDEWRVAPEPVRDALWRYAECGGVLLVVGDMEPPVPCQALWTHRTEAEGSGRAVREGFRLYEAGLGRCAVSGTAGTLPEWAMSRVVDHARRFRLAVWMHGTSADGAHRLAPVVKELSMRLGLCFTVLAVFALVAGPGNLIWLRRKNRGIWLFWIAPLLGIATSGMVMASVLFSEGLRHRARIEGMTILDERVGRATTVGINGYYCPLRPRGGLSYSYDTEVTACSADDRSLQSAAPRLRLAWDEAQHLDATWVQPRVVQYFRVRSSELRQERLGLVRKDSGLAVVNGLGAPVKRLLLADFDGTIYELKDIGPGEQIPVAKPATLSVVDRSPKSDVILLHESWSEARREQLPWSGLLQPGTYLAYLDGAPFVPNGLRGSAETAATSIVLGILREEERP